MLLVLKTDVPNDTVVGKLGDYGAIFAACLEKAGLREPVVSFDVVNGEYPSDEQLAEASAILYTGSKHDAWADDAWIVRLVEYTKQVLGRKRLVGICFGHQVIARALGARVGRSNNGWEIGSCTLDLTSEGRQVFSELGPHPSIMQMHHDIVLDVPSGTMLLASNANTRVQAFYRKNEVLCVQGHPEFTKFIVEAIAERRFTGAQKTEALHNAAGPNDGPQINKTIVDFIAGRL